MKQEEARFEEVVDRTNTLGTVWLGLTVGCAQCHDHKYDPISQREYYELFSFMNSTEDATIDAPLPGELGPYLQALPGFYQKRNAFLEEYRVPQMQPNWEASCVRPWITLERTWTGTFRSPLCAPCWMELKSCCARG